MEATLTKYLKRSPVVLLPALALVALLLSAVVASLFSWAVLYRNVVPNAGKREAVYLQYGHGRAPHAYIPLAPAYFASDQNYDITLELDVPISPDNIRLGNFMANLALIATDRRTLVNISRPATLNYHHPLALQVAAISPFSFMQKVQHLTVPLLEAGVLQTRGRIPTIAFVELGRNDAYHMPARNSNGELQVYRAALRFDAHLTGLRFLLYYHPIIAFLLFTPSFLLSELLAAFSIWAIIAYRSSSDSTTSPPFTGTLDSSSSSSEDDDKSEIKLELDDLDEISPVASTSRGRAFGQRMDATGAGGVLVRESEDEADEEEMSTTGSGSWEGIEEGEDTEVEQSHVKGEDDDDAATIGGSETTRATGSSFGPSLASTRASTATTATTATT